MRVPAAGLILMLLALPAVAQSLPSCNSQVLSRHGDQVTISTASLTRMFNQQLHSAHSQFSDLQLTPQADNHLKISGKKNGTPVSISGPLQVASNGDLQLHAEHINKGGSGVKGLMEVFGQSLSDYLNLHHTQSLSVQDNNLRIDPEQLLGLRGRVKSVHLQQSRIIMQFSSQPCR